MPRKPPTASPQAPLKATLDRVEAKVDSLVTAAAALLEATQRLTEATAALLAHAAHPAMIAPVQPVEDLRAGAVQRAPVARVPRGTEIAAIVREAESDPRITRTLDGFDLNSQLAAELASYAAEDEEAPPPPSDDDLFDLWRRRLSMFRQSKLWQESWGPRPGQEGCGVPHQLLNGGRR